MVVLEPTGQLVTSGPQDKIVMMSMEVAVSVTTGAAVVVLL